MAALKSDNVSKEQLIDVLTKMNKKVKVLSTVKNQLTERCENLQSRQDKLLHFVKEDILNGTVDDTIPTTTAADGSADNNDVDKLIQGLQNAWHKHEEQQHMNLSTIQAEFVRLQQEQQQQHSSSTATD